MSLSIPLNKGTIEIRLPSGPVEVDYWDIEFLRCRCFNSAKIEQQGHEACLNNFRLGVETLTNQTITTTQAHGIAEYLGEYSEELKKKLSPLSSVSESPAGAEPSTPVNSANTNSASSTCSSSPVSKKRKKRSSEV